MEEITYNKRWLLSTRRISLRNHRIRQSYRSNNSSFSHGNVSTQDIHTAPSIATATLTSNNNETTTCVQTYLDNNITTQLTQHLNCTPNIPSTHTYMSSTATRLPLTLKPLTGPGIRLLDTLTALRLHSTAKKKKSIKINTYNSTNINLRATPRKTYRTTYTPPASTLAKRIINFQEVIRIFNPV